jgi:hypothetical protein
MEIIQTVVGRSSSQDDSVLAVWNLMEASVPQKVLKSRGLVTSMCFGPGQHAASAVLAGTESGALCLWDLSESSFVHDSLVDEDTGGVPNATGERRSSWVVGDGEDERENGDVRATEARTLTEMMARQSMPYTVRSPTYVSCESHS